MQETLKNEEKSESDAPLSSQWKVAKTKVNDFMENWVYIVFSLVLVFYVLFANDVRQLIPDMSVDTPIFITILIVFAFFVIEMLLLSMFKDRYFLHFFFWMDLISTLTILLDIDWISNAIFGSGNGKTLSYAAVARAARAARVGTRIGRIVRVLRLLRLLRVIKVYKMSEQKKLKEELDSSARKIKAEPGEKARQSIFGSLSKPRGLTELKNTANIQVLINDSINRKARAEEDGVEEESSSSESSSETPEKEQMHEPLRILPEPSASRFNQLGERRAPPGVLSEQKASRFQPQNRRTLFPGQPLSQQKQIAESDSHNENYTGMSLLPRGDMASEPNSPLSRFSLRPRFSAAAISPENAQVSRRLLDPNSSFQYNAHEGARFSLAPQLRASSAFGPLGRPSAARGRGSLGEEAVEDEVRVFDNLDFATTFKEDELNVESVNQHVFEETNVGRKLGDSTMKRIIIIVLLLMISIPLFSLETYIAPYSKYQFGLDEMRETLRAQPQISAAFNATWDYYIDMLENDAISIISLELYWLDAQGGNSTLKAYYNTTLPAAFRDSEIESFSAPDAQAASDFYLEANLDYRYNQRVTSILSISRTIFLCCVFAGAALIFTNEATNLVLEPIEGMMKKIKNITENPLAAAIMEEEEAYFLEKVQKEKKRAKAPVGNETDVLLQSITKIGALLAVGFGEAGSEIIVQNMENGGALNPMIPGRKVLAVYGFCDIRNFTDATEVLQENVMMFVNDIAEIVHSKVDFYGGKANKNIGDAFLLVWKVDDDYLEEEAARLPADDPYRLELESRKNVCCELALLSFVQIMVDLNRNCSLSRYNEHPGLKARIRNFKVRMGFGLHLGWAIEGAIGSEYKIDASYLSPHVNMASRLEAATKQFGTSLLVSQKVAENVSPPVAAYLRRVDVVRVKGSAEPMTLYTFDGEFDRLKLAPAASAPLLTGMEKKSQKYKERMSKNVFLNSIFQRKASVLTLFETNVHIKVVRTLYTPQFYETWNAGFEQYLQGTWKEAAASFRKCLSMVDSDGPAKCLIEVIGSFGGQAPADWDGVRSLTEK